jgi:subtilisin family serine protease
MTCPRPATLLLSALFCALAAAPALAVKVERLARVSPSSGKVSSLEVASGSALVRFKAGVSTSAAAAQLAPAGFSVTGTYERFNWSAVSLPPGMGVQAGLAVLAASPLVEWAEPNRVYRPYRVPDDPYLTSQYALARVQAFGAWEYETGASSHVTVAVIDTGIEGSHPELLPKLSSATSRAFTPESFPVASNNQPPTPACNHATRVAGVAAAASDNGAGVAGMSWGAGLISMKVFADADCDDACCSATHDCSYSGNTCGTTDNAIAAALNELIPLHNKPPLGKIVVNISLGSPPSCSAPMQPVASAAAAAGLLVFAAAGNASAPVIDSPADCAGVYPVGATDQQDNLAYFSNTDSTMTTKGLTAPGVDLFTTSIGGGYASATGTSFASPMAAGLAALIWSAKPNYTAAQVFDAMKNSADDLGAAGPDRDFGWGRINAMKALRLAATGTTRFAGTSKAVAYPNPFRPSTHRLVTFTVPAEMAASGLEVKVYTQEGELVRKLDSSSWDGKNDAGAPVASGVYLFRVKTDKDSAVGKMALVR